jgi:hypothetical protein
MDDKSKIAVTSAVATLLNRWRLTESQKIAILGFESDADLASFFHSPSSVNLPPTLEQRLSLILNIHEKLRLLFSNPENTYGFMTMVNNNSPFLGKRPIDLASQGADGLIVVHKTLLSMFGGTK